MESFKIAIADDHSLFRKGMKELLQAIGNQNVILEARTGKELLEGLLHTQPQLILMDNKMPDMDGIEATKLIRQQYPDIKIVALSMFDDDDNVLNMIKAGANAYLLKNADLEVVLETIEQVMTKGYHYDASTATIIQRGLAENLDGRRQSGEAGRFSEREYQILSLSADGLNAEEIGERLFISKRTVENHRKNMIEKVNCKNMVELIAWAFREGVLK